jgi:hypothetical protein
MSREIKFKVTWNSQVSINAFTIGEFIDGAELEFSDGSTLPMNDIDWETDEVEYIQFTGLLDKNGKEIYEGDIVAIAFGIKNENPLVKEVRWDSYSDGEYVSNVECWCAYGFPLSDPGGLWGASAHTFEVIGNIYENPELLK